MLLSPPYVAGYMRTGRWLARSISGTQWYPIWLAYCTGLLEKQGHEARLVDGCADNLSAAEVVRLARDFSPELVVVYITTPSLDSDNRVVAKIKEATGAATVYVGPWCSQEPETILSGSPADAIAIGEFDYTVLELANGQHLSNVSGLLWQRDGQTVSNSPRAPVPAEKLDEFPFVTDVYRRHLHIRNYHEATLLYPYVDLFTGRGCAWGRCTFCSWPFLISPGASYRTRSIESVIGELRFIKEELPFVKQVFLQDDTLPQERAQELSQAILDSGLRLTWSCYARPDMDYETLKLMHRAGCRSLHVGYESASQQILKQIVKGTSVKGMERFSRDAERAGFIIHGDFIVGLPGETAATIRATIDWARRQPIHGYQFTTPKPYPGTPLHQLCQEHGYLKEGRVSYPDFTDADISYWTARAIRECHLNPAYVRRVLRLLLRHPTELGRLLYSAWHVFRNVIFRAKVS